MGRNFGQQLPSDCDLRAQVQRLEGHKYNIRESSSEVKDTLLVSGIHVLMLGAQNLCLLATRAEVKNAYAEVADASAESVHTGAGFGYTSMVVGGTGAYVRT